MYSLNSRYACKINIFVKFIQIIINKVFLLLRNSPTILIHFSLRQMIGYCRNIANFDVCPIWEHPGRDSEIGKASNCLFSRCVIFAALVGENKRLSFVNRQPCKPGSLYLHLNSLACEVGQSDAFVLCTSTEVMYHLWG